jgi:ribosomal-protein-alanine N-acetyltransferase
MIIRPAGPDDAEAIERIERQSGGLHWDYLRYDCTVADAGAGLAGYLVVRTVTEGEFEILNVAVEKGFRRSGIAESLIRGQLEGRKGDWFLEVRESNIAARGLYKKIGFQETGRRPGYYSDPSEPAIVMSIRSC